MNFAGIVVKLFVVKVNGRFKIKVFVKYYFEKNIRKVKISIRVVK